MAECDSVPEDSDYFRYFNVNNGKTFALVVFFAIAVYHACIRLTYGDVSCVGLLEDGRYQGNHIWQPYGCMLHEYTPEDARLCMKYMQYWGHDNWFVLMGDARVAQLHAAFSKQVAPQVSTTTASHSFLTPHSHLTHSSLNFTSEYYKFDRIDNNVHALLKRVVSGKTWPKCIVIASPLMVANDSSEWADLESNVTQLVPLLKQMASNTTILWMHQPPVLHNINPNITYVNQDIDQLNAVPWAVLYGVNGVKQWRSTRLLSSGYVGDSPDGILLGGVALAYDSQILLNLYCNDVMNFDDGTCCSHPETVKLSQMFALVICSGVVLLTFLVSLTRCRVPKSIIGVFLDNGAGQVRTHRRSVSGTYVVRPHANLSTLFCVARLCLLLLFFFACDRANWLMKENKWFTHFNFLLPTIYLAVLGIFFNEESNKTCFMHRDQTDEWKGWMVLVIMCYNMTGASKDLRLYMVYRCMISGLLFHFGYGQFMYLWTSGQYGLHQVFKTLFRYNLVGVLLCVVMGRPYQFYFYVPLVSYWFVVLYITMALPPTVTGLTIEQNSMHVVAMVAKFVFLFFTLSVLFLSEVFFENVFVASPWKYLFVTADDGMQQWWFNWSVDRYTVPCGMVLAFVVCLLRRHVLLLDHQGENLVSMRVALLVIPAALASCGGYVAFVYNCGTKPQCEQLHAYLFFLPIVGYIVLRNVFGCIRGRVSGFFAWFGRISLELLVCQGHVWLAADWHGVLVLFPRWPVLNALIVSLLFVCVAHELHACTLALADRVFPEAEPAKVVRSVVTISALLLLTSLCSQFF